MMQNKKQRRVRAYAFSRRLEDAQMIAKDLWTCMFMYENDIRDTQDMRNL